MTPLEKNIIEALKHMQELITTQWLYELGDDGKFRLISDEIKQALDMAEMEKIKRRGHNIARA